MNFLNPKKGKLKKEHRIILDAIEAALIKDPTLRFGQALFNLSINQFVNPQNPDEADYKIRDIHGDKDADIIQRIKRQNEWFDLQRKTNKALENKNLNNIQAMTVNERLFVSGLMDDFDNYKNTNKDFAKHILERLKVDENSIDEILK